MGLKMIDRIICSCATAALAVSLQAVAQGSSGQPSAPDPHIIQWISFDPPGSTYTQGSAINDSGEIVGWYQDSSGLTHGFLRTAFGEIVTFDPPGAAETVPTGINNRGDIVGYFSDSATPAATHGFVWSPKGEFTIIDDPNANTSPVYTAGFGISDTGAVVGTYSDTRTIHGFLREPDGSFITIDVLGSQGSACVGINVEGEAACQLLVLQDNFVSSRGLVHHHDGKTEIYDAPGAVNGTNPGCQDSCAVGGYQLLNVEGEITGYYADANGVWHGYVRHADGRFTEFMAPGTSNGPGTVPASINWLGTVVGSAFPNRLTLGDAFVRFHDGELVIFDAPVAGQQGTQALAVNAFNEFTGLWVDANFVYHGYVAVALP
jgi:probable HAF family extracellular repeat protein